MTATYRLQLTPDFGFAEVEALVPYLKALGVSHLYLSPITEARPGSTHGYDVVDHTQVRAAFGGREGFESLRETAAEAGLGLVLDFVPNHAGVGPDNEEWQDVLAYGRHSAYAHHFDIDWAPLKPELQGKVLLPFLGDTYGTVLDDGGIGLSYEDGTFYATYYEHRFALSPRTYPTVLNALLPQFERTEAYFDLQDVRDALAELAPDARDRAAALCRRLDAVDVTFDPEALNDLLDRDTLHELLEAQHWRLAYWKTAGREINYRRFFTINDLVGLRMEDEDVFWETHRLLGDLLAEEAVDGVRIDHIDGLFDPHEYLGRLKDLGADRIWVEKILAPHETLPEEWPVEGTTGYDFLNDAMGALLYPKNEEALRRTYRRAVPDAQDYETAVYHSKLLVIEQMLSSELTRLSQELDRLSEADYHTRDVPRAALREALREGIAALDRYRTFLPHTPDTAREVIEEALHRALQRNPAAEPIVYAFVEHAILGELRADLHGGQRDWVGRLQQYTGPVAAKGIEDTALYRYVPLTALNEVGSEPGAFGTHDHAVHARNRFRAREYPETLLTTATHDHKRGADTRMRLLGIAERPERWAEVVASLTELGDDHRGPHGPSDKDAYLFFQTLAALWTDARGTPPAAGARDDLADRIAAYMEKAAREAKQQTSWINPDTDYEADLKAFVRGVTTDPETPTVLNDFAVRLAEAGFANRLSQLAMKCTAPGVPDVYRGTEGADLSLVDPDNRRPVDWEARRSALNALGPLLSDPSVAAVQDLFADPDPRAYLYLTARLLRWRRSHSALAAAEGYVELTPEGDGASNGFAFGRFTGPEDDPDAALLTVVARYPLAHNRDAPASFPLPETLAKRCWTDVLTGTSIDAVDTIRQQHMPAAPVAVLASE
ncbi:malto-oligosyltrehalose synthase [Salinibacter grassmerensis]|uniref:malto-oligosyltrehalose synthase n=1 Tax=Salinibacter grassmerensis TaxID=3040353 RepID=UPI0021E92834|nr:malto-oligosyltrehalose synthase [Salinibacter grassmerensis]